MVLDEVEDEDSLGSDPVRWRHSKTHACDPMINRFTKDCGRRYNRQIITFLFFFFKFSKTKILLFLFQINESMCLVSQQTVHFKESYWSILLFRFNYFIKKRTNKCLIFLLV